MKAVCQSFFTITRSLSSSIVKETAPKSRKRFFTRDKKGDAIHSKRESHDSNDPAIFFNFPQICPKMPQNGPKMAQNDPKWPKVTQI